ncbi:MAG TPA: [LysW]-aminoadipate kinase [Planctomycetota bacterium]|nr:[LysW]-aminoadipate kinase [Planctomycetota bacterium]
MMILKIGGGAAINLAGIAADIAALNQPVVVVHGANALRDDLAKRLGIEKRVLTSVSGYSSVYSDEDAIDLLMMAYAGSRNKRLVELLQRQGVNAIGLSGLDGRLVQGSRNKGIRTRLGEKTMLIRDFSGKPRSINTPLLKLLLENGYLPVLCVPIIDEEGFAINSENDDIVTLLQRELIAETVIHLIEAPGFLSDPKDENSLVDKLTVNDLAAREREVEGRMKRKILALRSLFEAGTPRVILADGRVTNPVRDALEGKGTVIE